MRRALPLMACLTWLALCPLLTSPAPMGVALSPTRDSAPFIRPYRPSRKQAKAMEVASRASVRVVSLYGADKGWSMGKGCGVNTEQGVLTCWHVVEGASAVYVAGWDGALIKAAGWARIGTDGDLAVLRVSLGGRAASAQVADSVPTKISEASCFGWWGAGHETGAPLLIYGTVFPGALLPKGISDLGGRWISAAFPIMPGMSGAGVWVGERLVGLCSHAPADGNGMGYTYIVAITR